MKWISVEESLPRDDEWVLVCAGGAVNCMAYIKRSNEFKDWTLPVNPNIISSAITHWAHIETPEDQRLTKEIEGVYCSICGQPAVSVFQDVRSAVVEESGLHAFKEFEKGLKIAYCKYHYNELNESN